MLEQVQFMEALPCNTQDPKDPPTNILVPETTGRPQKSRVLALTGQRRF